jgi:hypothetical protein
MFKGSRPQVNRVLENGEKPSEFGLGSELGCNPDDLRVELAGYWSHLLLRVKKQSKVPKRFGDEFRGIENVNGGPCQVSGADFRDRLLHLSAGEPDATDISAHHAEHVLTGPGRPARLGKQPSEAGWHAAHLRRCQLCASEHFDQDA